MEYIEMYQVTANSTLNYYFVKDNKKYLHAVFRDFEYVIEYQGGMIYSIRYYNKSAEMKKVFGKDRYYEIYDNRNVLVGKVDDLASNSREFGILFNNVSYYAKKEFLGTNIVFFDVTGTILGYAIDIPNSEDAYRVYYRDKSMEDIIVLLTVYADLKWSSVAREYIETNSETGFVSSKYKSPHRRDIKAFKEQIKASKIYSGGL